MSEYRFTERSGAPYMLSVWNVSKCGICEVMKLCVFGRSSNSAETYSVAAGDGRRSLLVASCLARRAGIEPSTPQLTASLAFQLRGVWRLERPLPPQLHWQRRRQRVAGEMYTDNLVYSQIPHLLTLRTLNK